MKNEVPIHHKYMLTVDEASQYFHIGENKLRQFANEHVEEDWVFFKGQTLLIKRELLEKRLNKLNTI